MKILCLMPYSPVPKTFGGALRIYYLLKNLASEHQVTALAFGTPRKQKLFEEEFGDLLEEIHIVPEPHSKHFKRLAQCYSVFRPGSYSMLACYSPKMQNKLDELLAGNDFDAVHTEFPFMGQYEMKSDVIKILDAHNVEHDNFRRMGMKCRHPIKKWFYRKEYEKVKREEVDIINQQDMLLTTSETDLKLLRQHVENVPGFVVPNGVDSTFFTPSDRQEEPFSMVFTGMMGYTPNHDGMLWFLDEIFPRILRKKPEAKVYIVGNRPPEALKKRRSDNIVVTGFVDDVRPYVWKSAIFVVPLRMGSGTRLKVVEALAMKKPVVSTSIGCEGIDVEHGKSILIEDDPAEFASAVVTLMEEKELALRLSRAGYKLVQSTYDWSVVGQNLLDLYKPLQSFGKEAQKYMSE